MNKQIITYNDDIVRKFAIMTMIWGVVGLLLGVLVASQMAFWQMNLNLPWFSFGRLRPLHTNAAIFAFVGNCIFTAVYYSMQRLLKVRVVSDFLANVHFWGWQLIIVLAAVTLPLGFSQAKEYAELEWPIDILVAVVWLVFAFNVFAMIAKRNVKNIYVAIWFYIATIVTITMLYVVNNLALPVSFMKSYSLFAGVQDALIQWWYGHNAVAFFLTTPILGLMYYFMPKAIGKPVYSYKLSIIHFWALIFIYIWAGPHHLMNQALPDWAQSLGMVFSLALWAPSWGGMINGLLTLRGAWEKLRTDPVVKFFAAGVTFYGMSTFEGPLMSIKSVNALAHFTDWVIGHVHGGTLGWNGFMAVGMLYWLVPRLWGTKLYSTKLANFHFWVGIIGILLYMAAMYTSGLTQGLMWRAISENGTLLYPNFLEAIEKSRIMYHIRMLGGILYLVTFVVGIYNMYKTIRSGKKVDGQVEVLEKQPRWSTPASKLIFSPTMLVMVVALGLLMSMFLVSTWYAYVIILVAFAIITVYYRGVLKKGKDNHEGHSWHSVLEGKTALFVILSFLAVAIGGAVQIIPMVTHPDAVSMTKKQTRYSALELMGRDVYLREGCYTCHSQMVRPLLEDVLRYGNHSEPWESMYDHPFQWGSKRTGPDLARVGGKYPNLWHYKHMIDPRSTSAGSIMPAYPWLEKDKANYKKISDKIAAMKALGVPYTDKEVKSAAKLAESQAKEISEALSWNDNVDLAWDSELTALIAYLQRLGTTNNGKDQ